METLPARMYTSVYSNNLYGAVLYPGRCDNEPERNETHIYFVYVI